MSDIEQNLAFILSSRYGKDVRRAIHDAIHDCYEDGKAGSTDLVAREQIANLVANSGNTDKDSEIVDARVSASGHTYSSLGEAIRANFQYLGYLYSDTESYDLDDYTTIGMYWVNNQPTHVILNCPITVGALIIFPYSDSYLVQCLISAQSLFDDQNNAVFIRSRFNNNWSEWVEVVTKKDLDKCLKSQNVNVNDSTYMDALTDANTAKMNSIYFIDASITSKEMVANLPLYSTHANLIQFNHSVANVHGLIQLYIGYNETKPRMYYRIEVGHLTNHRWSEWVEVVTKKDLSVQQVMSCSIFEEVCVIGDSYTSGHIDLNDSDADPSNPNYSWPHYMEKITGNTYYNCGISGATVLSWLTNPNGLEKTRTLGVVQAYIIGLGLNDRDKVSLGSVDDIGTENQTYYGGLSKIVRELHIISPNAKIFIQTMTKAGGRSASETYNKAVKDIVEYYKNDYPIHLLDLDAYKHLYDTDLINNDYVGGHQTAIGYRAFAQNLCYVMSDYINSHIPDFQDVYQIPLE